ncbi:MAG TPA: DNA mismatch repair protein MutS [Polyangiaceae bacterium]
MSARTTPVMQQHAAAKSAYPDAIVFFRLGDFYEMFGEDAVVAAPLLDLTLTSRNRGKPDEIPMAGVPHHAAHQYIGKLLELGYKIAICEQMADPSKVKGIVPREVVRVITPGLVTDREQLDAATNNYLAAAHLAAGEVGLALLDLSTGELLATSFSDLSAAVAEIGRAAPREALVGGASDTPADALAAAEGFLKTLGLTALRRDDALDEPGCASALGVLAEEARALAPSARLAVARVLRFARACNPGLELPLRRIVRWDPSTTLIIDRTAQTHLELVESPSGRASTLLAVIQTTVTPPGSRLLRRQLLAPLADVERIRRRLDRVELFVENPRLRDELRGALGEVGDLERLATRAALAEATPRELGALRDGLLAGARSVAVLETTHGPAAREALGLTSAVDTLDALAAELDRALVERPPRELKEGAVFREGFDAELDELAKLERSGAERMVELETTLRQVTGIPTLKVRFTRVFGWYIEVTRSHAGRVPEHFRRKQTVAAGERFTTPELDELADRITHAEERHRERELALYRELVRRAGAESERIRALAARLARWDVSSALAEVAHRHDYARPLVDAGGALVIRDARHPVVERAAARGRFVPNDVELDLDAERLWLVTGPNMAGKSTLLRQVALIVVLAQMGSYVPARHARIGLVDRVLSRVGASDNLARGESTFMVEMRETAEILRSATRRSLVILDELGRGTSTFDGLAIAWAVAEFLDEAVGCRALFATHYHELTALAEASAHAANVSVSARELDGDVVFLHRLVRGAASRSYGVAVAKLAGLPESILARARAVLALLESGGFSGRPEPSASTEQLDLFAAKGPTPGSDEVLLTLKELDLDRLTGLEALKLLERLKAKL